MKLCPIGIQGAEVAGDAKSAERHTHLFTPLIRSRNGVRTVYVACFQCRKRVLSNEGIPDEQGLVAKFSRISAIESSLRSVTWFLPGKFQDSELASEAIQSFLNVLGVYHDSVLHRTVADMPSHVRPPSTAHARYTRWWTKHSKSYARLSRTLAILNYTSLLMEMTVRKKRGRVAADQTILILEAAKAAIRLAILRITDRAVLQPPVPEREVDPSVLDLHRPQLVNEDDSTKVSFTHDNEDYWTGAKAGVTRPTLASLRKSNGTADTFLTKRVLTLEHVQPPKELVTRLHGIAKIAEIIWIMRPLLYGRSTLSVKLRDRIADI